MKQEGRMEKIYHMPVRVKIDSDNPDRVMRGIAKAIYDAVVHLHQG